MQVEVGQQFFFERRFDAFTEQKPVRQDDGGPSAVRLQQMHDQRHEQIGGFPRLIFSREVLLDAVLFHAAKRRIGDDAVDPFLAVIILQRPAEGVVVANVGGHINPVQHHVGHRQHVGQRLLFNSVDRLLQYLIVLGRFHLVL